MKTCVFLLLLALVTSSCASAPAALISPDVRAKIAGGCAEVDEFAAGYPARRAEVIANREWIEELLPQVWGALAAFDERADEIYAVVTLVCDMVRGVPTAEAALEAKRIELARRGINWAPLIDNAARIAVLLLQSQRSTP